MQQASESTNPAADGATRQRKRRPRTPGNGASRITDRANGGPFSENYLREQIREGRLIARKAGRATLILDEDWNEFLRSFPVATPELIAATPGVRRRKSDRRITPSEK